MAKENVVKWVYLENITTIIGAVVLSCFLVWFTGSLLGLLGLFLLLNINYISPKPKKCPQCGNQLVAE